MEFKPARCRSRTVSNTEDVLGRTDIGTGTAATISAAGGNHLVAQAIIGSRVELVALVTVNGLTSRGETHRKAGGVVEGGRANDVTSRGRRRLREDGGVRSTSGNSQRGSIGCTAADDKVRELGASGNAKLRDVRRDGNVEWDHGAKGPVICSQRGNSQRTRRGVNATDLETSTGLLGGHRSQGQQRQGNEQNSTHRGYLRSAGNTKGTDTRERNWKIESSVSEVLRNASKRLYELWPITISKNVPDKRS
jgi:hypothetical protein